MSVFAPEAPTTAQLEAMITVSIDDERIARARKITSSILNNPVTGLIVASGPCSLTGPTEVTERESQDLANEMKANPGLITLQRRNFWKPRSDPRDWHGPETTEPTTTYERLVSGAHRHANGAAEIATMRHLERYGKLLTFGWFGSRNNDLASQIEIAQANPTIPLGYKNPLEGKVKEAVKIVAALNDARGAGAAPVVLLYRGGEDARTPAEWEEQVRKAFALTGGRMILDLAHGSEMAHDPNKEFKKSIVGQIHCLHHAERLAREGIVPAGYLMEASDIPSLTDPNMPHEVVLHAIPKLIQARMKNQRNK